MFSIRISYFFRLDAGIARVEPLNRIPREKIRISPEMTNQTVLLCGGPGGGFGGPGGGFRGFLGSSESSGKATTETTEKKTTKTTTRTAKTTTRTTTKQNCLVSYFGTGR